jgi:ATP-binding cassette subfamily B (MDR/TAP) protein 9
MATNTFLSAAVVAGVLFYGGTLVLHGSMSAGALVSFMLFQQSLSAAFQVGRQPAGCGAGVRAPHTLALACPRLGRHTLHRTAHLPGLAAYPGPPAAQALGDVFSSLSAAVGAADKVVELMRRRPGVSDDGALVPGSFAGRLELRDVVFHYPARPAQRVLHGLSLVVQPGEVVALVGPSGGGKSSIVKLLQRFYLPDEGGSRRRGPAVCVCVWGGGGGGPGGDGMGRCGGDDA